jgi:CHAT domain-containing protein
MEKLILTRPFDKHLDSDELDELVSSRGTSASGSKQLSEHALGEAQRHVESCQDCSRKLQMHKSVHSEILRMRAPNPSPPTPECLGEAEWLEVAAGLYPDAKTRELMKHAAQCGHCGPLLKKAAEILADETTPDEEALLASLTSAKTGWRQNMAGTMRSRAGAKSSDRKDEEGARWWQAFFSWPRPAFAFAGIAVAIMVGWLGARMLHPPSAEQLLALAYTQNRTLEARIPGAKYAPMRVARAPSESSLDKSPSLLKAEALIAENLQKNPNDPAWLQAKARADLLDGNYESAIKTLQRALETQPESPGLLTDLGAAYFVRAESADRPIDYGNAIDSLGKALAKSPDDPVALFNRALACERMFLYTQAVDDWEHYLRLDPNGEWADDARKRLAALREKVKKHEQSQAEPTMTPEEIAESGTKDTTRSKIEERIEDYLSLATTDWLPKAYPVRQRDNSGTAGYRSALGVVAEISNQKHGDRWLMDVLSGSTSRVFTAALAELAVALKADDVGDNIIARQHARESERLFASSGNDAGALRARVEYVFAAHAAQEGSTCIEASSGQNSQLTNRPYVWLRAQFHLELGTCYWLSGNLGKARYLYEKAAGEAAASGYGAIYLRTQDHLSSLNASTGIQPDSWARTHQALERFWSGHYPPMRGYNLYYNIYEFARNTRQPYLQMTAWRDGISLSESFSDNGLRAMAHSLMASAAAAAEEQTTAEKEFTQASQLFALAPQIKSTRIARVEAEARLAEVETNEGRPQSAVSRLRQLEPEVDQLSDNYLAILFDTTLGNAESMAGADEEAESALRSAISVSELQLQSLSDDLTRVRWSQRASSAYRNLAQLRLRQGDTLGALEIWAWYRGSALRAAGNSGSTMFSRNSQLPQPREVAAQLSSLTNETFVSYALLPHGLAIWVYDNRGVFATWTEKNAGDIEARANRFLSLCSDSRSDAADLTQTARALYGLLVAPIERYLSADRTLVIELDDGISGLPFDALIDTQNRYLGDRGPIVSSLGIYYRLNPRVSVPITADSSALVAAVSTSSAATNSSLPPLPDAVSEGEIVAHDFNTVHLLAGNGATLAAVLSELPAVSVFHFAGHAISSPQQSGLLLSDALLNSAALRGASLTRTQLAVFSACDTQDGSTGGVASSDSLVRVFLRAGVSHVVASRWNVDSAATREFMELFYQTLLAGNSVARSIHQAQTDLRSRPSTAHPYYWSAFAAFGEV